mmetsp:Transcript_56525/g.137207  ORF Transcript_56525/g.137207 Transcript_56525/m.137207 type:complete len:455 (-) Transcript_56525:194-1558(-)
MKCLAVHLSIFLLCIATFIIRTFSSLGTLSIISSSSPWSTTATMIDEETLIAPKVATKKYRVQKRHSQHSESADNTTTGVNWWLPYVEPLARAFPKWKGNRPYEWCIPQTKTLKQPRDVRSSDVEGLIYIKNPKAASSTSAGITLQIAHNVFQRIRQPSYDDNRSTYSSPNATTIIDIQDDNDIDNDKNKNKIAKQCTANWTHPFAFYKGAAYRRQPSLLWTTVREPGQRMLSLYYHFLVSRKGYDPTNATEWIRHKRSDQLKYINTSHKKSLGLKKFDNAIKVLRDHVIQSYDFIAITERMDESLVVMKILFDLEDRDMIVLSAKKSGSSYDGEDCRPMISPRMTPEIDEFFKTNYTTKNFDYLLYALVNRSLDMTIDEIGRDRVEKEVKKHRLLKKIAHDHCQSVAAFPCSSNRTYQPEAAKKSCYAEDCGCGYSCVQDVLQRYEEGTLQVS